jgi:hypothetical protein
MKLTVTAYRNSTKKCFSFTYHPSIVHSALMGAGFTLAIVVVFINPFS